MEEGIVQFDKDHNLRIFDPEKFKESKELQEESLQFVDSECSFFKMLTQKKNCIILLKISKE